MLREHFLLLMIFDDFWVVPCVCKGQGPKSFGPVSAGIGNIYGFQLEMFDSTSTFFHAHSLFLCSISFWNPCIFFEVL